MQALVDGVDSPALREVAGLEPDEVPVLVDDLVAAMLAELAARLDPDPVVAALVALARRVVSGALPTRSLTTWAHLHGSHDSPHVAIRVLSELDDVSEVRVPIDAGDPVPDQEVDPLVRRVAFAIIEHRGRPSLDEQAECAVAWTVLAP